MGYLNAMYYLMCVLLAVVVSDYFKFFQWEFWAIYMPSIIGFIALKEKAIKSIRKTQ